MPLVIVATAISSSTSPAPRERQNVATEPETPRSARGPGRSSDCLVGGHASGPSTGATGEQSGYRAVKTASQLGLVEVAVFAAEA